jgi:2-dehydropantoate 2-reductase
MNPDSLLIVGTGALGTLFAHRLASAGVEVTVLGTWREGLSALQRRGARLAGAERSPAVRVAERPRDCRGAQTALVLVKAWQTGRAAAQLADCLAEGGLAFTLQNGLGNQETLSRALGEERVSLGVTTLGANLIEPGLVQLSGEGPVTLEKRARSARLQEMLRSAGFQVEVREDAQAIVWGKLVVSAALNPLTALLRVPNGALLDRPAARNLLQELAQEAAGVAAAKAVRLPFPSPVEAVEQVARQTAENRSSMLQDVLRGAPTEIDAINGSVVRLGEESGVPVVANRFVLGLVKALTPSPNGDLARAG